MRGLALLALCCGCAAADTGTGVPARESWRAILGGMSFSAAC
jgi:hypothetical protein